MSLRKLREIVKDREAWHAAVQGVEKRHNWATELNWGFENLSSLDNNDQNAYILFKIHVS